MKVKLVTAYVPIKDHPRGPEHYGRLGELLSGVPVQKKCFYQRVDETWLHKVIRHRPVVARSQVHDNAAKNTLAYHCVQHQKTEWLRQASTEDPDADVLVWVDYGIFNLPGINNKSIYEFFEKLNDKAIYAPGCWHQSMIIESVFPCWRFCGSVLAVPKQYIDPLDYEVRTQALRHLKRTNTVDWEVNTWARVEHGKKLPFHWYKADHNVSMFDNLETI